MNIEETETLAFTYDLPFHTSFGKISQRKLRTSTMVNDGTLRSTADFTSTLSNVNNVKISDLLEFLVLLFFPPFDDLENSLVEVFFPLHLQQHT